MRSSKILERGQLVGGRIVGIHISYRRDPENNVRFSQSEYAIEVHTAAPFVAGVQQSLWPDSNVRLGMEVAVRVVEREAVIDWHATCGGRPSEHTKVLSKPPGPGIVDEHHDLEAARRKWTHADCTILGAQPHRSRLGLQPSLHIDIGVEAPGMQPFSVALEKVSVPFYATHLCGPGTRLPVWVRSGHSIAIQIDWPEAAMAFPGVGWPSHPVLGTFAG